MLSYSVLQYIQDQNGTYSFMENRLTKSMELAVGAAEILLHNGADFTCALASYFFRREPDE